MRYLIGDVRQAEGREGREDREVMGMNVQGHEREHSQGVEWKMEVTSRMVGIKREQKARRKLEGLLVQCVGGWAGASGLS